MSAPNAVLAQRVRVIEVGPRDGFQMEEKLIPTELKVETLNRLAQCGLREIEAVSFVHPRVIPQMRDAAEVMAAIERHPGVRYWALVPNQRGTERALAAQVDGIHLVVCATETYNQRNVGLSIEQSIAQLRDIVTLSRGSARVAVTLAATFGCPFEGQASDGSLLETVRRLADTGVDELGLADSAGLGHPLLVRRIVRKVRQLLPELPLRLHLHDTRGLGLANAMTGLEEGVAAFDTSLGGLGGCPIMRGASGNIATEDFVNLLQEIGIGGAAVDLTLLRAVAERLQDFLGRPLPSRLLTSGTRAELYALNQSQG